MQFLSLHQRRMAWRLTGAKAAPLLILAHPLGMHQGIRDELMPHCCLLSRDLPGPHPRAAHRTGVTTDELRQGLMQVATCAGVPAANHAFSLARQHGRGDQ